MNTNQILKCIREDSILNTQCSGVFALDKILPLDGFPTCCIVNTDPHNHPGSHWVAVFIDHDRNGDYFDSYGRKPHKKPLLQHMKKHCIDWVWNEKLLQCPYSSVCGQYCLYFLYHRVRGETMSSIMNRFGGNLEENDLLVCRWVNENYDVNTNVFDMEFMLNQMCRALLKR